ncbi:MAG: hypothetical protein M1814_002968 [Vezdaea aestivalis]|nr:MAG: hypothetical protein M1814_002968 [Vezdaea aestivalis]
MAITTPRQTEALISSKKKSFFPAHIPIQHWQLRQLVTAPTSHPTSPSSTLIYYASDVDIYCLDTATNMRDRIVTLPFAPRCLAADYGWLCAGGDTKGQFAAVQLCDLPPNTRRSTEVDALLSLGLEGHSRRPADRPQSRALDEPVVQTQESGESIVNSVTIHGCKDRRNWSHDGPIAVITNNDMTVRICHLPTFRMIHLLNFDIPMNHASISPNGKLLVAVGDRHGLASEAPPPVVHFCRKVYKDLSKKRIESREGDQAYEWIDCGNTFDIDKDMDSCFTSTFSPSGKLCAVGSQDGHIVVYDTDLVLDPENNPIVAVFQSSQQGRDAGAVRSLNFVRGPWDLLVWTEHYGRAGIVDARDGFSSRQYIDLRPNLDTLHIVKILDNPLYAEEASIDPQLRPLRDDSDLVFHARYRRYIAQGEAAAARFAADYHEASAERRRLQRHALEEGSPELSDQERFTLETLRTSQDSPRNADTDPISNNNGPLGRFSGSLANSATNTLANAEAYINSTHDNSSPTMSLNEFIRSEHQLERERLNRLEREGQRRRIAELRRQVVESRARNNGGLNSNDVVPNDEQMSEAIRRMRDGHAAPIEYLQAMLEFDSNQPESNRNRIAPLREARAEVEATIQRFSDSSRVDVSRTRELITELEQERSQEIQNRMNPRMAEIERRAQDPRTAPHARRLRPPRHQRDPATARITALGVPEGGHPANGPGSSGCAISPDGRRVFVATESGILQLEINVESRRFFPMLEPI